MKKPFKLILGIFLLACSIFAAAQTDVMDMFVNSFDEQQVMAQWVVDNGPEDMTLEKAQGIVKHVYAQAYSNNLNPQLVLAMIKQESNFNKFAKSRAGAKGLMQVMPKWHRDKLKGRNPYSEKVSIEVGSIIFRDCLDRFSNNKRRAFSCYSGGAKNYMSKVTNYQRHMVKYIALARQDRPYLVAMN